MSGLTRASHDNVGSTEARKQTQETRQRRKGLTGEGRRETEERTVWWDGGEPWEEISAGGLVKRKEWERGGRICAELWIIGKTVKRRAGAVRKERGRGTEGGKGCVGVSRHVSVTRTALSQSESMLRR